MFWCKRKEKGNLRCGYILATQAYTVPYGTNGCVGCIERTLRCDSGCFQPVRRRQLCQGEYTLPGITQSVIITRMAGRTSVPQQESVANLAEHGCSMVVFLSAGMLPELQSALLKGAYTAETPAR